MSEPQENNESQNAQTPPPASAAEVDTLAQQRRRCVVAWAKRTMLKDADGSALIEHQKESLAEMDQWIEKGEGPSELEQMTVLVEMAEERGRLRIGAKLAVLRAYLHQHDAQRDALEFFDQQMADVVAPPNLELI